MSDTPLDQVKNQLQIAKPRIKKQRTQLGTPNQARRLKFIELCATTTNALADNYLQAGYNCKARENAATLASRLSRRPEIKEQIDKLRARKTALAVKKAGLSLEEANEWLRNLVLTPASQIDADSPLANGVKSTQFGQEIRIPDKLGGIKLAMELQGLMGGQQGSNPFGGMALQVVVNTGANQPSQSAKVIELDPGATSEH